MDQDGRLQTVLDTIERHMALEVIAVDRDISDSSAFLKLVNVKCHNWVADFFPKIGALRFAVKMPAMDALNMILYPEPDSDAPIFLFFFLITGRKVICHFNVNTPFAEETDYREKWIKPLDDILASYPDFECSDRYPPWMQTYRHDCTVYGLFKQDRLADLSQCSFDYLEAYLSQVVVNEKTTDPERLSAIEHFHNRFKEDIRTRDKAQGMTSKFIGKEKARRIFYEVVT